MRESAINKIVNQRDVRAAWRSAPGSNLIPRSDRELFVEQFEKDIQFFQLFSC